MKWAIKIGVGLAFFALGFWLWTVLFPSPEKVIRSRLNALAKAISFKAGTGAIAKAYNAEKVSEFFATDVSVEVNLAGFEPISLHGRDEILQIAGAAGSRLTSLKVEFPDMNITFGPDGNTAKVNLTGKATIPGERDISAQEFNFQLKKVDGKWLIFQIETVRTLSSLSTELWKTVALKEHHLKPMNSADWIESVSTGFSEGAMTFPPLPGRQGRGEGERKHHLFGG